MLEELFHPFMVIGFLEESQQLKVGFLQVTIHLGAAAISGHTGFRVPLLGLSVVELIFANATACIIQIDVLRREKGTVSLARNAIRCKKADPLTAAHSKNL
jgi:hypothetical protein